MQKFTNNDDDADDDDDDGRHEMAIQGVVRHHICLDVVAQEISFQQMLTKQPDQLTLLFNRLH